ncbi:MAG TPA: hypothetical protein VFZ16_05015 [Hyphomicrobiaceae bacterium]|nr:hypothetical protein [Hyphomicrobiaceae bacterium]
MAGIMWMTAGFMIWASALITLYAFLSMGCLLGWQGVRFGPLSLQRLLLLLIWTAHAVAIIAVLLARRHYAPQDLQPEESRLFIAEATSASTAAALVATLWTGAPILHASPCV